MSERCASCTTGHPVPTRSRFSIHGMDCPTEEGLIRKRLDRVDGIDTLDFDLINSKLTVTHRLADPRILISEIAEVGMTAIPLTDPQTAARMAEYRIENMDCPTEETLIRDKLGKLEGVVKLRFNLMQRRLSVEHALADTQPIEQALVDIGMRAEPLPDPATAPADPAAPTAAMTRRQWTMMAVAGVAAVAAEAFAWGTGEDASWPVIVLALAAIFASGLDTYKKGLIALRNFNLNINALMAIAVTGAVIIGKWPEAAMVMFLFSIAEMIEALSLDRARNAIRKLMEAAPEKATIRRDDGTWEEVPVSAVASGMVVRIKPGERLPLDGEVIEGRSAVNQAPITGESMPVDKGPGDKVFAGSINETGSFEFRVTAAANQTTLARIIKAVEEAQGSRAPTQRFVDQFARIYTPAVLAIAVLVALVPPLAFGLPWMDWIYKALVLLVIACPCALVISTPVTIVSGLAAAARRGMLIKGGVYLELGRKIKSLALDKTGTITAGKPAVTDLIPWGGADADAVLTAAAALATRSDHPVSLAIARRWTEAASGRTAPEVEAFAAITGRGVRGELAGAVHHLGNHRLVEELGLCSPALESALKTLETRGKTAVIVADSTKVLGILAVADRVRETSKAAVADLHVLGVRTLMLTGDNPHTAAAIAREVGIDDARGDQLPEDKLAAIEAELKQHGTVGMVGDGINDAPALAKSSIGFAMGAAGTDTAIETADVALMDDDLRKIPAFIRLSRATATVLKQNIALALGIKAVFLALAVAGQATLWMAVFADMGASLLVVLNGLRLLRSPLQSGVRRQ
ncbi:MAG: heavy metal translocating P-type ATPase [Burkholderiales bacterium]|nr:heavy metal translocating P-type ATPase [Burkholderiales bacterium]